MTIHRALGFVDRANVTDDSPLRVIMASEGRQADGIDLRMSGADLSRYRGNPVLGYGHSYYGRMNLPIGRVNPDTMAVDGTQLAGSLEFDQGDEFAREVERKMRAGFLNAVSIGFDVLQWESADDNYWRGGVATKWELSELSVVPVPMDAAALVTSGRGLDPADPVLLGALRDLSEDEFARLLVRMQAVQNVAAGRGPLVQPTKDDPEPLAQVFTQDAARSLLAAFAPTKEN